MTALSLSKPPSAVWDVIKTNFKEFFFFLGGHQIQKLILSPGLNNSVHTFLRTPYARSSTVARYQETHPLRPAAGSDDN